MSLWKCSILDDVEDKYLNYIPVLDCTDILKTYQIQAVLQGGGQAFIYKTSRMGHPFALKIMPADESKSALGEIMIGCSLGPLVDNNISKAYLVPVGWRKCNILPPEKYLKGVSKMYLKGGYYYLVMPWADYVLSTIKDDIDVSDYDILSMVFELLYGLVVARFYFIGFSHNDIKAANIFVNNTLDARTYQIEGHNFYIKSNLSAVLADFGQSYAIPVNEKLYGNTDLYGEYRPLSGRNDIPRLIDSFISTFPRSSLVPQLRELKTLLSATDQGYQDYKTIINTLVTHKLFDRLKISKHVTGDNIINMVSWEDATKDPENNGPNNKNNENGDNKIESL